MTDKKPAENPVESQEQRQAGLAPETHNDEQDDHREQAQEVTEQARGGASASLGIDSDHVESSLGAPDAQDLVDHMKQMREGNTVDMSAYRGEPNHDDNVDKFGKPSKPDGLRGDGT